MKQQQKNQNCDLKELCQRIKKKVSFINNVLQTKPSDHTYSRQLTRPVLTPRDSR